MNPIVKEAHGGAKPGRRWLWPSMVVVLFALLGSGTWFVSAATTTASLFAKNAVPSTITASDSKGVELGVRFEASVAGQVTGVRFYKGAQNTGTHTGELWDQNGDLLATATFKNETSSGWQTVSFAQPVQIAANVPYVVSYYAPHGRYSYNYNYFTKAHKNGKLTALASTSSAGNGLYGYSGSSVFPTQTYKASNYWVDVLFNSKVVGSTAKPAPPASLQATQGQGVIQLSWPTSVSANPLSNYYVLRDGTKIATVSGSTLTYNDTSVTAGTTYSYQIEAVDNTGAVSAPSVTATVTYNVTPTPPTPTPPTPTPPATNASYVQPGTQGYRGAVADLTVYSAANGKVPAGTQCSWGSNGIMTCSDTNLTLDHAYVQGSLQWKGCGNLTISNSILEWQPANGNWFDAYASCPTPNAGATITVTNSTFDTANDATYTGKSDIGGLTVYNGDMVTNYSNSLLKDFPQGIDPGADNSVIKDNEIYTTAGLLCWISAAQGTSGVCHEDGIFNAGSSNNQYINNYIDVPNASTAAIFYQASGSITGNSIVGNFLKGGSYTIYNQQGASVNVENNTFGGAQYGDCDLYDSGATWGTWSGNVNTAGTAIVPQGTGCN